MSHSSSSPSSGSPSTPSTRPPLSPIELVGPETQEERGLREWAEGQVQNNMAQLEEAARQLIQLVTALFGVLFAVLAISDGPEILQILPIKLLGSLSVVGYFISLLAALYVIYPWENPFEEDNLTEIERLQQDLIDRKANALQNAFYTFVAATGCLALLILVALWQ